MAHRIYEKLLDRVIEVLQEAKADLTPSLDIGTERINPGSITKEDLPPEQANLPLIFVIWAGGRAGLKDIFRPAHPVGHWLLGRLLTLDPDGRDKHRAYGVSVDHTVILDPFYSMGGDLERMFGTGKLFKIVKGLGDCQGYFAEIEAILQEEQVERRGKEMAEAEAARPEPVPERPRGAPKMACHACGKDAHLRKDIQINALVNGDGVFHSMASWTQLCAECRAVAIDFLDGFGLKPKLPDDKVLGSRRPPHNNEFDI